MLELSLIRIVSKFSLDRIMSENQKLIEISLYLLLSTPVVPENIMHLSNRDFCLRLKKVLTSILYSWNKEFNLAF